MAEAAQQVLAYWSTEKREQKTRTTDRKGTQWMGYREL